MDDLMNELERLAGNATAYDNSSGRGGPSEAEMQRWMKLFQYSRQEAAYLIQAQRNDVTRDRISDAHWELVREEREKLGYDREAYEHELRLGDVFMDSAVAMPGAFAPGAAINVVRLGGLLKDATAVMEIAELEEAPRVVDIMSEEGIPVRLCAVSEEAKRKIGAWLLMRRVVEKSNDGIAEAEKLTTDADKGKAAVVVDTTLPQHRAS